MAYNNAKHEKTQRSKVTPSRIRFASLVLAAALLLSCSPRASRRPAGKVVFRQEGIASWYGGKFHGRLTASGERYNMYGISAAHRTLPLGTVVRVTHIGNGRKLTLRINDRGPFVEGRIIDLSLGAARKLDAWLPTMSPRSSMKMAISESVSPSARARLIAIGLSGCWR